MGSPSESGIRPAPTLGVKVPRHMRESLQIGGTGDYLSGLKSAHEAALRKTANVVTKHVADRTNRVLDHKTPQTHAIAGVQLPAHLNEHVQHGSTGDHREALIAASIAARTRGQLDK